MNRYVSFGLLVAVILVLAFLFYKVMVGFFVPLFLAALLVVIFRPMHLWYLKKFKDRHKVAAAFTTASILLVVLLPIAMMVLLAIGEGRDLYRKLNFGDIGQKIVALRIDYKVGLPASNEFHSVERGLDLIRDELEGGDPNEPVPSDEPDSDDGGEQGDGEQGDGEQSDGEQSDEVEDAFNLKSELQVVSEDSKHLLEVLKLSWSTVLFDSEETDEQTVEDLWRLYSDHLDRLSAMTEEQLAAQNINEFSNLGDEFLAFKDKFVHRQTWAWARDMVKPLGSEIVSVGSATTGFLINLVFGAAIMIIALYFFLLDGPAMLNSLKGLSPLDDDHEDELVIEFDRISRAVVVATLLSAVVQGILAAIGFYFAGVESVFLLMLATTVLALIPFVGAAAVWAPVAIWLFFVDDRHVAGVLLAIYGMAVVSMADNIIKPLVLHGQSNIHPLWALLSVLGGVAALGPMGILVGPMIVAFLQTMLNILQKEMKQMEEAEKSEKDVAADS